ncbi:hypothetical protein D3C85_698980 [compost metagenome]
MRPAQCQGFRWGHVVPAHAAGKQVVALVADHAQEGVVGFGYLASRAPDDDADDVGVHQPANLRLALSGVAVQARVLQRDRRL